MTSTLYSTVLNCVVIGCCTFAVLCRKVYTTSLEIFALGVVCIGSLLSIDQATLQLSRNNIGTQILNVGVVLYVLLVFARISFKTWLEVARKKILTILHKSEKDNETNVDK